MFVFLLRQFPGLKIDRVRRIDPTGVDLASPNIDNVVKLDEKRLQLFADYDEEKKDYILVIGRSEADQLITLRRNSYNISGLDGPRFMLYVSNEERRSSDGTVKPFPFYVFDLKNLTVAVQYLGFLTSWSDRQRPRSFEFYGQILSKLS